jgi:hypothetical protein
MREIEILTLPPLMVAALVTLYMAAGPSVRELTRMLEREDLLWAKQLRSVNNL